MERDGRHLEAAADVGQEHAARVLERVGRGDERADAGVGAARRDRAGLLLRQQQHDVAHTFGTSGTSTGHQSGVFVVKPMNRVLLGCVHV